MAKKKESTKEPKFEDVQKRAHKDIGFHIKYMIKRRYRTNEAFLQSTGLTNEQLSYMLRGSLHKVTYPSAMILCEALDLNPFDFMPDPNYELNRFKMNKILTMYTQLNYYGRRKIMEHMADYLLLPKYTDRLTPLNDLVETKDHVIDPMPPDAQSPELINPDARISTIPLTELPQIEDALIETVAEGKNLKVGKIKSGRYRKQLQTRISKQEQELEEFNNYLQSQQGDSDEN